MKYRFSFDSHKILISGATLFLTCANFANAATPIDFQRALELGIANSRQASMAKSDVEAEQEREKQVLAGFGPRANVSFSENRFDKAVSTKFGPSVLVLRPDEITAGSFSIEQPLVGLYTNFKRYELQQSQSQLTTLNKEISEVQSKFLAASAYLAAQQAREFVKIAQASLNATENQVHDAQSMVHSGRLLKVGFLKIDLARLDAKALLAKAEAAREKASANLAHVLGTTPSEELILDELPSIESAEKMSEPYLIQNDKNSASERLEIKQSEIEMERAQRSKNLVATKFLPSANLFAKWDHDFGEPPFGYPKDSRTLGLTFNWEIWDNGSRFFALSEQSALISKSRTAHLEKTERYQLEINALVSDLKAAREALIVTHAGLAQAEEAYRLEKARFASGLSTATDLVLSETAQTKVRGNAVVAIAEVQRLMFEIQRSSGQSSPSQK